MIVVNFNEQPCLIYRLFASEKLQETLSQLISLGFNVDFFTMTLDHLDIGDVVKIFVTCSQLDNWRAGFIHAWRIPASENELNSVLNKILTTAVFADIV